MPNGLSRESLNFGWYLLKWTKKTPRYSRDGNFATAAGNRFVVILIHTLNGLRRVRFGLLSMHHALSTETATAAGL
jgi:hypothetical protein